MLLVVAFVVANQVGYYHVFVEVLNILVVNSLVVKSRRRGLFLVRESIHLRAFLISLIPWIPPSSVDPAVA